MFNRTRDEDKPLRNEIDAVLLAMSNEDKTTERYVEMVTQLERLYAIRNVKFDKRVSPDTKAAVLGNLLAVAMIVGHERANVITSKALNFIKMAR
jgi:hypothetical protein